MTEIYVSPTGSDSAAGTTAAPLKTIGAAVDRMGPGVEVVVRAGTYAESLTVSKSGSAAAWAVLRAEPGAIIDTPRKTTQTWNGIRVDGANYVKISGFEIKNAQGDGISIEGSHHVEATGNHCHDNGESGIQADYSEFLRIEGNITHDNATSGYFSGISVYQCRKIAPASDRVPLEGDFTTIVRNNISYDNVTKGGQHSDGNGIIIDDFRSTQNSSFPPYLLPTLVENNLTHGNGGKGIQVTWSDNVTLRRNTSVKNNVDAANDGTWRGDTSISESQGCSVIDCITVAARGSGPLANNRALGDTTQDSRMNKTTFKGNIAWDPAGTPSLQNDGGNPAGSSYGSTAILWANPDLGSDFLPRAAAAAGKGWSPSGVVTPTPLPDPVTPTPVEPTPVEPDPVEPAPDPSYNVHSLFAGLSPTKVYSGEGPLELGTRIRFAAAGTVTALRVYRLAGNGSATVRAWRGGKIVAKGTMAAGAAGWVDVPVSLPVAAGDEIVVSWGKPNGKAYPAAGYFFDTTRAVAPIAATAGLFAQKVGALPVTPYQGTYYWTDVAFQRA